MRVGLLLFFILAIGCANRDPIVGALPPAEVDAGTLAPFELARGRAMFLRYCALCHGQNGEGYAADAANALGNPDFLAIADRDFLFASIRDGRPGTPMSPWGRMHGGPLDDEMIDIIVSFLRTLATEPSIDVSATRITGSVERGRTLWATNCVECHGETGEGSDVAPGVAHPALHAVASDGCLRRTIEHGRRGTPMRGFADLPSQSIDDLVAFVRSIEHAPDRPAAPTGAAPPGVADLVMNPDGAPPAFTMRDDRYVSADAVKQAIDEHRRMVILDARATSDWALGHIPGAAPFPFYDIEQMSQQLPRDGTWILAYCACPHAASGRVVDTLRERGFANTAIIDEGIHYWTEHGFPVETGAAP